MSSSAQKYHHGDVGDLAPRDERLRALRAYVVTRWYGATRAQICERFPEWYSTEPHTAGERRFYRDLALLEGVVRVSGRWVRRERAHAVPGADELR